MKLTPMTPIKLKRSTEPLSPFELERQRARGSQVATKSLLAAFVVALGIAVISAHVAAVEKSQEKSPTATATTNSTGRSAGANASTSPARTSSTPVKGAYVGKRSLPKPAIPETTGDENHPLGLLEAVTMARTNYPALRATAEKVHQAEVQVPLTTSVLYPTIQEVTTASEQNDPLSGLSATPKFGGSAYNEYLSKLHVAQPLIVFGSLSAIDSSKKDRDVAKLNVEIGERNLISNVIQAFYQVVLDMRNVETLKRQERIEREALVTNERRSQTGRAQYLDVLQARTQIALLQAQIETAENTLQVAAANLATLLGDTDAHSFRVKNTLDAPPLVVVDSVVDLKNFKLPELEVNRLLLDQIDDQKRVQLGQNLPNLAATADLNFGSFKQSDLFNNNSQSWDVMLTLTIPIFSGFSMSYQQQILESQRVQLEYTRQDIQNTTTFNQVSSRKNLETAAATIRENEEALHLAIASSDEARRMYRFATIDFLNFLNVQNSYVQAEQALNSSKYSYIVALANYFVNSGQDLSRLIEILEKSNL